MITFIERVFNRFYALYIVLFVTVFFLVTVPAMLLAEIAMRTYAEPRRFVEIVHHSVSETWDMVSFDLAGVYADLGRVILSGNFE